MKNIWILNDGKSQITCDTFPFAFRRLWAIRANGLNPEEGKPKRTIMEMMKSLSITSPLGKVYGYAAACEMARSQDLLDKDGNIDPRPFKKYSGNKS